MLVSSFQLAPDAAQVVGAETFRSIAHLGSMMFAGAVSIALPTMAALLLVNLAFGVMSRSAPTLNGMSVGFPLSLAAGFVLLSINLPSLSRFFAAQLEQVWMLLGGIIGLVN